MSQHSPKLTPTPRPANDFRIAVVSTKWNSHITTPLRDGCVSELSRLGVTKDNIETFEVPGAVELTFAASKLIETSLYDCVVVIGCVIRGGTPHFDYVCSSVTQGVTSLNADCDTPVIFGVLTVDDDSQARERLGKGAEYAAAAVEMVEFNRMTENL